MEGVVQSSAAPSRVAPSQSTNGHETVAQAKSATSKHSMPPPEPRRQAASERPAREPYLTPASYQVPAVQDKSTEPSVTHTKPMTSSVLPFRPSTSTPVANPAPSASVVPGPSSYRDSQAGQNPNHAQTEKINERTLNGATSPTSRSEKRTLHAAPVSTSRASPHPTRALANPAIPARNPTSSGRQDGRGQPGPVAKTFSNIVLDAKAKVSELARKHHLSGALSSSAKNHIAILESIATLAADVDRDLQRSR